MSPRTIQVKAAIVIPRGVSFLRYEDTEMATISIEELTDDELRKVGEMWTEDMIKRAQERRHRPKDQR